MKRSLQLLLPAGLLLFGCRAPLSNFQQIAPDGDAVAVGRGYSSCCIEAPHGAYFPAASGSDMHPAMLFYDARTRSTSADSGVVSNPEAARPGTPQIAAEGPAGRRRLFITYKKMTRVVISPDGEDVVDCASLEDGPGNVVIAWHARGDRSADAIRAARMDGEGATSSTRVAFDADKPVTTKPCIAAIGAAAENACVVAFEASARSDAPKEVRLARVAADDGRTLRAGAAKSAAFGLAWSRSPRIAGRDRVGLLVFEGADRGAPDDPWIYGLPLNESGDPVGKPVRLARALDGEVSRGNATPFGSPEGWFVAWEERRGGSESELYILPIASR